MRFFSSLFNMRDGQVTAFSNVGWSSFSVSNNKVKIDSIADKSLSYSSVWRAVTLVANSIANLDIYITVEKKDKKGKVVKTKDTKCNAHIVLNAPSLLMNLGTFIQTIMIDLQMEGNSYVGIKRYSNGNIAGFEIIKVDRVKAIKLSEDGKTLTYYLDSADEYTANKVDSRDILHFKNVSIDGGYTGLSVISQARKNIKFGLLSTEFSTNYVENGFSSSGFVTDDGTFNKPKLEQLQEIIKNQSGTKKAGELTLLPGNLRYIAVNNSAKDAEFLASRQFNDNEIAKWFSIPAHLLEITDKATFNNLEQRNRDFVNQCLMTYANILAEEFTTKLLKNNNLNNYKVEFSFDNLFISDILSKSEYLKTAIRNGTKTINELRQDLGYNAIDNELADELLISRDLRKLSDLNNVNTVKRNENLVSR